MADKNVIRQDVVEVGFEIQQNPFGEIEQILQEVKGVLSNVIDSFKRIDTTIETIRGDLRGTIEFIDDMREGTEGINNDGLQGVSDEIENIRDEAQQAAPEVENLSHRFETLGDINIRNLFDAIKDFPTAVVDKINAGVEQLKKGFLKIKNISLKDLASQIKNIPLKTLGNGLKNIVTKGLKLAAEAAKKLLSALKSVAKVSLKGLAKSAEALGKGLGKATAGTAKLLGKTMIGMAGGAAVASAGIYKLTNMASDLYETENKISSVFGDGGDVLTGSAKEIGEWANSSIKNMGLARQTALDMTALFGDMGTSMGMSQKDAATMSMSLTQLGADLASFKNIDIEQATTALNGIFTGETESLKSLGVVMTQTNLEQYALTKGIKKKTTAMTQAELVQLRYNYVMDKTKTAQGDFVKTGGGFANQVRMLGEQFKELGTSIGSIFMPVLNKGIMQLNSYATELNDIFRDGFQDGDMDKVSDILSRALDKGAQALESGLPKIVDFIGVFLSSLAKVMITKLPSILSQLLESVRIFFYNLMDVIRENKDGLVSGIVSFAKDFVYAVVDLTPEFILLGAELVTSLLKGIAQELPTMIPSIIQTFWWLLDELLNMLPDLMDAGVDLMLALAEGLVEAIPKLAEKIPMVIENIVDTLLQNLDKIIDAAMKIVDALVKGLTKALPKLLKAALKLVIGIAQGLIKNLDKIIDAAIELAMGLVDALIDHLDIIIDGALSLVLGLARGIINNADKIIDAAITLIERLTKGLIDNVDKILIGALELILELGIGLIRNIPTIIKAGFRLVGALVKTILAIDWIQLGWKIVEMLGSTLVNGIAGIFNGGEEVWHVDLNMDDIFNQDELNKIKDEGIDSFKQDMLADGHDVGDNFTDSMAMSLNDGAADVQKAMDNVMGPLQQPTFFKSDTLYYPTNPATGELTGHGGTLKDLFKIDDKTISNMNETKSTTEGLTASTDELTTSTNKASTAIEGLNEKLDGSTGLDTTFYDKLNVDESTFENLKKYSSEAMQECTKNFNDGLNDIERTTNNSMKNVVKFVSDGMKKVVSTISKTSLYFSGQMIMTGLIMGITGMKPALEKTVQSISDTISKVTDKTMEIHSPSKVMFEKGQYIGEGQMLGMLSKEDDIRKASIILSRESTFAWDNAGAANAEGTVSDSLGSYYPDSSDNSVHTSTTNETNHYSPQFILNMNGNASDRSTERKVKQWVRDAMKESFSSIGRRNPRLTEV